MPKGSFFAGACKRAPSLIRRERLTGLARPLAFVASYTVWVMGARMIALTLITYFIISPQSRFQDISDAYGSYELIVMAVAAAGFVLLLRALSPLVTVTLREFITP